MSKIVIGNKNIFDKKLKLEKKGISFEDYGAKPLVEIDVEDTLYNTFKKAVLKNENKIMIRHNDISITYCEILKMVDNLASSLSLSGIKDGDIVVLPIKNCIEVAISLIAINKIGAISKWVDTDKSAKEFYDDLSQTNFSFLIVDNSIKEKIDSIKSSLNLKDDKILYVNSSSFDYNSEFVKFLNKGKNINIDSFKYEKDKPAIIITSSGSTGLPKEILHSSFSVNSAVKKLTYTDYPIKDNILTVVIPPYIGLGLVTTLYASMICGGEAEIISNYTDPFVLVKYIKENEKRFQNLKNNQKVLLFGAPMYFKALSLQIKEINDLSFIGAILAAGSKIEENKLKEIDYNLASKGCKVPVCNAYGQNEHCGGITYNTIQANKRGSAGKVAYGTRVMVVNPDTKEEMPAHSIGKIVEQSDSQFLGYNHNIEADKRSIFIDKDGEKWFDTKDLGCFDDDKFLHILDRESRTIIRFDNKVALAKIEDKFLKSNNVSDAIAVKVNIPGPFGMEQAPFAFVVSHDNEHNLSYEELMKKMQISNYPFTMLEMPIGVKYISKDNIPYKNGKVNYKILEILAQKKIDDYIANSKEKNKTKIKN